MNAIAAWFSKFTTGTHITVASVLALFGTIFSLYQAVPAFQTLCNQIYAGIPVWAQGVLMAAVGIFLFYYRPTATPASLETSQSEVKSSIAAKLGAFALIAVLLQGTLLTGGLIGVSAVALSTTGCTPAQLENEVNTILQEATGIIAVADPGVSWLADFQKATNLLKVDEANWIKGGAVQDVINVLTDLEGVTALISPLVPYASLITVLVAGIDAALAALLPAPSTASATMSARVQSAPNPWKGRATVTSAKDSKAQWNLIVSQRPELAAAKI